MNEELNSTIIHYSEIGLKGTNRPYFERTLIRNIERKTSLKVRREYGRLVIDSVEVKGLNEIPGIAYYAPAVKTKLDIAEIQKATKLITEKDKTVKINASRSNKQFKYTSPEINRIVGEYLYNEGLRINMKPEQEIRIEVGEKYAYIYKDKINCVGGLPVGVSGKLIALISGGIDSPVAAYKMIRRGCNVILVHFYHTREGIDKIIGIAKELSKYHGPIKVYLIPFEPIQRKIITIVPAKYRMITYRRFMLKIAELVLDKEKAKGFVTGDNIGQVASQTLDNLSVIYSVTSKPIFNPLSGFDKQEIINEAKSIGTYELSIKPYKDCCSYLIAVHPETRAKIEDVKAMESSLRIKRDINEALKNAEVKIISAGQESH